MMQLFNISYFKCLSERLIAYFSYAYVAKRILIHKDWGLFLFQVHLLHPIVVLSVKNRGRKTIILIANFCYTFSSSCPFPSFIELFHKIFYVEYHSVFGSFCNEAQTLSYDGSSISSKHNFLCPAPTLVGEPLFTWEWKEANLLPLTYLFCCLVMLLGHVIKVQFFVRMRGLIQLEKEGFGIYCTDYQ